MARTAKAATARRESSAGYTLRPALAPLAPLVPVVPVADDVTGRLSHDASDPQTASVHPMETLRRLSARILAVARERGPVSVLRDCLQWAVLLVLGRCGLTRPGRGFSWEGRRVPYVHHRYNHTWANERAVEVALAAAELERAAGSRVLEVGNVMAHYLVEVPPGHARTVVDKYEQAPGVLNTDVADLDAGGAYDLVLSVSTLEHVGWDEEVVDPEKPGRALALLKDSLAPGGRLWTTLPVGYNPHLDERLRAGEYGFTRLRALRRERSRNVWREVPLPEVWDAEYDRLLYTAHGVVIAEYDAPTM